MKITVDFRFINFPYEMEGLNQYLKALEESIFFHKREFERRVLTEVKNSKNLEEELNLAYQKIFDMQDRVFPKSFRNPFIILLWAVFESTMNEIANYQYKSFNCEIKLSDIRGNFLEKIKKYFNSVTKIIFSLTPEEDKELEILYFIRSIIAHGNGNLENIKKESQVKKIKELAKSEGILDIDYNQIILKKEYLERSFDLIDKTTSRYIKKVKQYFDNKNR